MTSLRDWTQLSWAYTISLMKCSTFNQTNEPVSSWCWPECKCDSVCFCNCQKPFPSKFVTPTTREESSTDSKHCGRWIQQQQSYKQGKKYTWWYSPTLKSVEINVWSTLTLPTSFLFEVKGAHKEDSYFTASQYEIMLRLLFLFQSESTGLFQGQRNCVCFKQLVSH